MKKAMKIMDELKEIMQRATTVLEAPINAYHQRLKVSLEQMVIIVMMVSHF